MSLGGLHVITEYQRRVMLLIQQVLCEELICDAYSAKLRIKYRPYLVCCDSGSGENTYRF